MKTSLEHVENYDDIMVETSSKYIIGSYVVADGPNNIGPFNCYIEYNKNYRFFSIVGYDSDNIIYIDDYIFLRKILPKLCKSLKELLLSYPTYLKILKDEMDIYDKSEYADEYPLEIWKRICYMIEKEIEEGNDINGHKEDVLKIQERGVSTFKFKELDFELNISPNNSIVFIYKNKRLLMETFLTEFNNPSVSFLSLLHCLYSIFMKIRKFVKLEKKGNKNIVKKK